MMWQTSKHANIRSRIGFFSSFSWANLALLFAVLLSVLSVSPVALGNSTLKETITELEASQQWQQTLKEARGQTVYFYAWGGSKPVNDYLRWAAREIASRYKVRLRHVKVADISEAVSRLKAEDGSKSAIDLLWINGENFSYLKAQKLLLGKLPSAIPNTTLLATEQLSLHNDFGVPMEGYEVPWGVGQFNLIANQSLFSAKNPEQTSITPADILSAAKRNPGRISYPRPPEFHGTTFLKQLLVALTDSDPRLFALATPNAQQQLLPALWHYLDKLHPLIWQNGSAFPSSNTEQLALFTQQQLDLAVSFNPNQMAKEQSEKRIASNAQRLFFDGGAITNSHNLAIPKGAQSPAGAKVVIHFLLSELAQKHKVDGSWGDPAVIRPLLDPASTLPAQQELHSSWQQVIEDTWQQKYGA